MKKSKWLSLTALTAAAMMVAGLVAGCGGGGSPAANSNEIKVGGNFELTGGIATFGQSTANGIKLAFKEANAAGGVLGKQIVFITADNKSEPSESTNATTKLIRAC